MDCTKEHALFLAEEARDYCLSHGIVMRRKANGSDFITQHAPFVLFPSKFPRCLFNSAKNVQQDFNLLVHKVSQDHEFLEESLKRFYIYFLSLGQVRRTPSLDISDISL